MKAPTDKANDTIQIVVTRRCNLFTCSNCTQLLPFRRDVRDMAVDVFRKALRSLRGWPGIRGIFGGNPCAHPRFADLMAVLVEEVPDQRQRGIWTNDLLGHGELVREVFYPRGRFNLNAHADAKAAEKIDRYLPGKLIPTSRDRASWHSPILMDWRDLGLSEAEWIEAREGCDINRNWSAAIFERDGEPRAYFCEVAGALDAVRGVDHSAPAVDGWWAKTMDHFEGQVRGCCDAGCGVPLRALGHLDTEDTYDTTPAWRSATARAKAVQAGRVRLVEHVEMPRRTERPTDYQAIRSSKPGAACPK